MAYGCSAIFGGWFPSAGEELHRIRVNLLRVSRSVHADNKHICTSACSGASLHMHVTLVAVHGDFAIEVERHDCCSHVLALVR